MIQSVVAIVSVLVTLPATPLASLEVIGSGYGRTGTDTLRKSAHYRLSCVDTFSQYPFVLILSGEALSELGYRTYHMKEIIDGGLSKDIEDWIILAENNCSDLDLLKTIFERGGWTAAVDFPTSMCWEQLIEVYPNAKVVHTERASAEKWWESAANSCFMAHTKFPINILNRVFPFWAAHHRLVDAVRSTMIKKRVSDRDEGWPDIYKNELLAAYSSNSKHVREVVPEDKLLIQDHSRGWNTLAHFLDKEIPDKPYPHANTRAEFNGFIRNLAIRIIVAMIASLCITGYLTKKIVRTIRGKEKNKPE